MIQAQLHAGRSPGLPSNAWLMCLGLSELCKHVHTLFVHSSTEAALTSDASIYARRLT